MWAAPLMPNQNKLKMRMFGKLVDAGETEQDIAKAFSISESFVRTLVRGYRYEQRWKDG